MAEGRFPGAAPRALERARDVLRGAVYGNALYRISLRGRRPEALVFGPTDPWPGNAGRGAALMRGEYAFGGQVITARDGPAWRPEGANARWLEALHGFEWLRDLEAVGGADARATARAAVTGWVARCGTWRPLVWRPDVLARRVVAWLSHATLILADADRDSAGRVLASLAEQTRHLARVAGRAPDGAGRIAAAKALAFAAACLPGDERRAGQAWRLIEHELERQVLPDGGHVSRSPSTHLRVFRDLVELRRLRVAVREPVPEFLQVAIDRMAPMLRFFRHGDGGLALFNDSNEEDPALIDVALALGEAAGRPPARAPHSGFERIAAGRTLVLVDVGAPSADETGHAHAGPLSFELGVGKRRLVVNCGAHAGDDAAWRRAQRATAAHSTVTLDDANAVALAPDGRPGRRPVRVTCERLEDGGDVWIDARHDGYQATLGVTHRRRLWLAADGGNLRGEDSLSGRSGRRFALRFHLHPEVRASLAGGGASALLRLPGGEGWRLRASGAAMEIAESVYLGRRGEAARCEQIVLTGTTAGGVHVVKWAFARVEA